MRKYIRHPSDIPIKFDVDSGELSCKEHLRDVSIGGLSFRSKTRVSPGTRIIITIPLVDPPFTATVIVKWCQKRGNYYNVGTIYCDLDDAFRVRMVEQVCHIEHYRRELLTKKGIRLTGEEAASEWIKRFAANFPKTELPGDVK